MVGTSQKWPAKAGGRSPKGPAVAGTTVHCFIHQCHLMDDVCTDMLNLFKHYYAGLLWSFGSDGS